MAVLALDRWDFLGTRLLLVLLAVSTTAVAVALPLVRWVAGDTLVWDLPTDQAGRVPTDLSPATGARLTGVDGVRVSLTDADARTWLVTLLPGAVVSLTAVTVVVLLLRLLTRIERGEPFGAASVTALRAVGATLLTAVVLATATQALADVVVRGDALRGDTRFGLSFELPLMGVLAAMLALALAEAFAHGVRLRDDVEGLV